MKKAEIDEIVDEVAAMMAAECEAELRDGLTGSGVEEALEEVQEIARRGTVPIEELRRWLDTIPHSTERLADGTFRTTLEPAVSTRWISSDFWEVRFHDSGRVITVRRSVARVVLPVSDGSETGFAKLTFDRPPGRLR